MTDQVKLTRVEAGRNVWLPGEEKQLVAPRRSATRDQLLKEYPMVVTADDVKPHSFVIDGVVTIYSDGRVIIDPAYTPDEAAKKFLEALQRLAPGFFSKDSQ